MENIRFKALEIGSGDAFLIETEGKQILFDSGGSKSIIKKLLKNNKKIDLAICSHNDRDHSNGFIGLLEDPKFEIVEIWLPGLWLPILNFLIEEGNKQELFQLFFKNKEKIIKFQKNNNEIYYNSLVEKSDIHVKSFNNNLKCISEITDDAQNYYHQYKFPNCHQLYCYNRWYKKEIIRLYRITKIAGLAYKKGSIIRWFKPENNTPFIKTPDYNFKPLNSEEVVRIDRVSGVNFFKLLYLTNENKYSLVFEFYKGEIPILLFSADSDYSFLTNKNKVYNNNIIVTSPHHGSKNNEIVYTKITGYNIIWVRSSGERRGEPCSQFKSLSNKYCLTCIKKNIKKEIEFQLINKRWKYIKGTYCDC